jgi:hypothetical protein
MKEWQKLILILTLFKLLIFICANFNIENLANRWDAEIFQNIAMKGYYEEYFYAFSPIYPYLIKGLSLIIDPKISAIIITNFFSYITPILIWKLHGYKTALLFQTFPLYVIFTTVPYSDIISIFSIILSYYLAKTQKNWLASLSLSVAIASRYMLALGLIAFLPKFKLRQFILPIIALSLIGFWYYINLGSPFAYFYLERKYWDVSIVTPYDQALWILNGWFTSQDWEFMGIRVTPEVWLIRNIIMEIFYLIGLFYIYKIDKSYFMYSLCIILPLFFVKGTVAISIPRLLLQAFPIFLSYSNIIKTNLGLIIYIGISIILIPIITLWHIQAFFS